jgi:hypothetical protein
MGAKVGKVWPSTATGNLATETLGFNNNVEEKSAADNNENFNFIGSKYSKKAISH